MAERQCFVHIDSETRKVLGRIVDGQREVKTQAWYLGRLIEQQPEVVRHMVIRRYSQWASAYGVSPARITVEFGPLPRQSSD